MTHLANGGIQIFIYTNRIEIDSPGGLPEGVTKEKYLNDLVSVPRNPVLAGVFYRLGIIELFGTGIRRIMDAYIGCELKPNFVIGESRIKIVLPVINYSENISDEEKVVNYLTIKNDADRKEIAKIGSGPDTKYRIR